jgi:hypothetical protein
VVHSSVIPFLCCSWLTNLVICLINTGWAPIYESGPVFLERHTSCKSQSPSSLQTDLHQSLQTFPGQRHCPQHVAEGPTWSRCSTLQKRRRVNGVREWCINILLQNTNYAKGKPCLAMSLFPWMRRGCSCDKSNIACQALWCNVSRHSLQNCACCRNMCSCCPRYADLRPACWCPRGAEEVLFALADWHWCICSLNLLWGGRGERGMALHFPWDNSFILSLSQPFHYSLHGLLLWLAEINSFESIVLSAELSMTCAYLKG